MHSVQQWHTASTYGLMLSRSPDARVMRAPCRHDMQARAIIVSVWSSWVHCSQRLVLQLSCGTVTKRTSCLLFELQELNSELESVNPFQESLVFMSILTPDLASPWYIIGWKVKPRD
jgi:hypothetical protein